MCVCVCDSYVYVMLCSVVKVLLLSYLSSSFFYFPVLSTAHHILVFCVFILIVGFNAIKEIFILWLFINFYDSISLKRISASICNMYTTIECIAVLYSFIYCFGFFFSFSFPFQFLFRFVFVLCVLRSTVKLINWIARLRLDRIENFFNL